jgi:hypothetical protein
MFQSVIDIVFDIYMYVAKWFRHFIKIHHS